MLVLRRKQGHGIVINDDIVITVVGIRGDTAAIGIEAPKEVPVHRREVFEALRRSCGVASTIPTLKEVPDRSTVERLLRLNAKYQTQRRRLEKLESAARERWSFDTVLKAIKGKPSLTDAEVNWVAEEAARALQSI